jgi:hypothetical protein
MSPLSPLAQRSWTAQDTKTILIVSLVLIGVLLVSFVAVVWIKRRLKEPDEPVSVGFSLSDLRRLHKEGHLSDDEYERARAKMIAAIKKSEKPGRKEM